MERLKGIRAWINGPMPEMICWVIIGFVGAIVLALLATSISVLSGYLFPQVIGAIGADVTAECSLWCALGEIDLFQVFFYMIIAFVILFGVREHLTTAVVKKERGRLYRLIRSMPPVGIMDEFVKLYNQTTLYIASEAIGSKYESKDKVERLKDLDNAIRACTDALSSLAFSFQRDDKARFASNVMTYHTVDSLEESDRETVLDLLDGMIDMRSFEGVKGYLMLNKELTSSTSTDDSFAPDELAENFAMPVPDTAYSRHNTKLLRLLPGAPVALEKGAYIIEDTHCIRDEIHSKCDVATSIGDNIHKYFTENESGKVVRSFISMRLTRYNHDVCDWSPLGVVNIHCDKVKLFADDEIASSYMALSQPFLDLISKLVFRRDELQTQDDSVDS